MRIRWPGFLSNLTAKLILIYLSVVFLGVMLVGSALRYAFRDNIRDEIKPHLSLYVDYIRKDLGEPPSREKARELTKKLPLQIHFLHGDEHWSTDGSPAPSLEDVHYWRRSRYHDTPAQFGHADDMEIAILKTPTHTVLFVTPDDDHHWRPAMLLPLLVIIGIFATLYFFTRRLFAPLTRIRSAVNEFGDGDLEQRLNIKRKDELGEVANSFNQMADRIQQMLESKRQLLLAISHELRSPLTRAKLATALLDNAQQRVEIEDELVEMEALVNELLETERFNAGHNVLNREQLDIVDLLQATTTAVSPQIQQDLPVESIMLQADATRLKLVIKNLLENACKYTPDGGPFPLLRCQKVDATIRVAISDSGPGIAPEHLPHISEPFYRVDPSRQRATGGYGLGLYLSRVIVEAHGGALSVTSELGQGTTVSISLPVQAT